MSFLTSATWARNCVKSTIPTPAKLPGMGSSEREVALPLALRVKMAITTVTLSMWKTLHHTVQKTCTMGWQVHKVVSVIHTALAQTAVTISARSATEAMCKSGNSCRRIVSANSSSAVKYDATFVPKHGHTMYVRNILIVYYDMRLSEIYFIIFMYKC